MTAHALQESNIDLDDPVDVEIAKCLNPTNPRCFFLFAGAGSGKTRSLVKALDHIRDNHSSYLAMRGHRVGVITYTNAARDEIIRRVDSHPLISVSTIHSFAWDLIKSFHNDIRKWLRSRLKDDLKKLHAEADKGRKGNQDINNPASEDRIQNRKIEVPRFYPVV